MVKLNNVKFNEHKDNKFSLTQTKKEPNKIIKHNNKLSQTLSIEKRKSNTPLPKKVKPRSKASFGTLNVHSKTPSKKEKFEKKFHSELTIDGNIDYEKVSNIIKENNSNDIEWIEIVNNGISVDVNVILRKKDNNIFKSSK